MVETYTEHDTAVEYGLFRYKKGILRIDTSLDGYYEGMPPGDYVVRTEDRELIFRNVRKVRPLGFFDILMADLAPLRDMIG